MKVKIMLARTLLAAVALMLSAGCASAPTVHENPCLKRRGAIDIGSGSTKAYAAVVDICQSPPHVVEKLFEQKVKISFAESVEKSSDSRISPETATDAAAKIATLVEEMSDKNIGRITMVATAAFRKAKNGVDIAMSISKSVQQRLTSVKSMIPEAAVRILSQPEEAELGARSAMSSLLVPASATPDVTTVVWDIGGGSMQMWSPGELFTGDLASVTFKNRVIQELQKKDPTKVSSPNPLSKNASKAEAIARTHAAKHVSKFFKQLGPTARWIGIGGVLAISVQKQVDRESGASHRGTSFTAAEVGQTLKARANRTDEEIESDFRETEVTNLALVSGYMRELKIEKVETVDASLVQGLVTQQ